jgi:adenylate cyclase
MGVHTDPVLAGVKKFQFDIWGDTVYTASRMESNGAVVKVNISQIIYDLLKMNPLFRLECLGKVGIRGKGKIEMYFVNIEE